MASRPATSPKARSALKRERHTVPESSETAVEHRHPALFPWFPAHPVHRTEQEIRAESLLSSVPLFNAVPPYRLRAITDLARRNRFSAGDTVLREGEVGATLHVIRSGRMNVVHAAE